MKKHSKSGEIEVRLTCQDRVHLLEVLPQRESIVTLRIVQDLRNRLSLSEDEIAEMGLTVSPDQRVIQWRNPGRQRTFRFTAFERRLIADGLKRCDQQKTLAPGHVALWDIFVSDGREVS